MMFKRRLYLQICALFGAGLVVFALIGSILWEALGHDEFNREMFRRASALATLLLPSADAPIEAQRGAIERIAEKMDFDVTLLGAEERVIAATGPVAVLPDGPYEPEIWVPARGTARWATMLPDGRFVVIDLNRLPVPNETLGLGLLLFLLALMLGIVMYPVIRRLTLRLERLQIGVEKIGGGDLSARVEIEGHDEVSRLAMSFNSAADRIEKLVVAQRMLLASASHELRTPLARIRLGIEMLQTKDDPTRRSALQKDIGELDALIDELILLTRLETERGTRTRERVEMMAIAAEECARYPDCTPSGAEAEVWGDPRMLQQLLRNLLDNAHKYGRKPVEVVVTPGRSSVLLAVSDAGAGIPDVAREQVFEPFYRLPGTQNTSGSGLGLPIVKKIAEAHSATISMRSSDRFEICVLFRAIRTEAGPAQPQRISVTIN